MNSRVKWISLFGEGTFWLAVICAILFSTSGWLVEWLKESFSSTGQLVVRAAFALFASSVWLLVVNLIDRFRHHNSEHQENSSFNLASYNKKLLTATLLCRPVFNLCFILAITKETATLALMILLFVKMLTNVVASSINEKKYPSKIEFLGYLVVTIGIVVYGWGQSVFSIILVFAVVSGFLEGLRLELVKILNISDIHKPTFAVFEFVGMLVVALVFLLISVFTGGGSFFAEGFVGVTVNSLIAMVILPLSSVFILAIDYYLSTRMNTGLYSAILATELGFAGVINYFFINSPFGPYQIAGLIISMVAIIVIKLVSNQKKKQE